MSFTAEDKLVGEVLNKIVFEIPRNQRRYVWKKENWEELMEDIYFSKKDNTNAHFIGSVVFQDLGKKEGLDYRSIIDGQQRLTTITLILLVIMKIFQEYKMEDDFKGTIDYVLMKNNRNQKTPIISSDYHLSLEKLIIATTELSENNNPSVKEFLATNIIDKTKDAIIENAYNYIYKSIRGNADGSKRPQEEILKIRDAVIGMQIIRITSSSEEDSYTIFEILNARGQELAEYELLKNYIMRYIEPSEVRDIAKNEWDAMENRLGTYLRKYIDHYAWHRYGVPGDGVSSYRIIQKGSKGGDIKSLLDDIKLKSEYYYKIVYPNKEECKEYEYEVFSYFKSKKQEQFRPVILSVMHQYAVGNMSDELYEDTLRYMYNFFICYNIIGEEKSNKLRDTVLKYACILENQFDESKLVEFTEALKSKIPSLAWFENSFSNLGWSNHTEIFKGQKNKQRVQITLEIIEKYLSADNQAPEYTIEHMVPDSDGENSAHIGNLIPLEEALNKRCEDKPLVEKIDIYEESRFSSARKIAKRIRDNQFDIDKRTKYLAQLVYQDILSLNK